MSVYTTFATGPKRPGDADGPEQFHVVLLDNGRSSMLGGEFHDMLRCIRCSACLNHCPVYGSVGGHAYGWCYSGPMGAVLMPNLLGMDRAVDQPNASTLCGKCEEVCPMRIPLPRMLRAWRERQFETNRNSLLARVGLHAWAFLAKRPWLYRPVVGLGTAALARLGAKRGRFSSLPLAGGWTGTRDLAAPAARSFLKQWKERSG
jgi:L-lactate dehydrogenase complex protein LldF